MNQLRRLLRLAPAERRLLATAMVVVTGVRLGLWLLPFRRLRSGLTRLSARRPGRVLKTECTAERIAWAVTRVSRYVPSATCLTQALAAELLLTRAGIASELRIGVAKDGAERLIGHAWIEVDGRVLLGGGEIERYALLSAAGSTHG